MSSKPGKGLSTVLGYVQRQVDDLTHDLMREPGHKGLCAFDSALCKLENDRAMLESVHEDACHVRKPPTQMDARRHVTDNVCWIATLALTGNIVLLPDLVPRKHCHLGSGQGSACATVLLPQYRRWVAIEVAVVAHDFFG